MYTTKIISNISNNELNKNVSIDASWHQNYKESSYIFAGNINYEMNEGDISVVFSQFGEVIDVHLVRNKQTGKPRGFAFIAYEDQRSTILAVDNLNGVKICGRNIRVDHVKQFRPPREYFDVKDEDAEFFDKLYKPSGPDGRGWGEFREPTEEEKLLQNQQKDLKNLKETRNETILQNLEQTRNTKFILDEDERWDMLLMNEVSQLKEKNALQEKIEQVQKDIVLLKKKEKKHKQKEKKKKDTQEQLEKKIDKCDNKDKEIKNLQTDKNDQKKHIKKNKHNHSSRSRSRQRSKSK